MTDMLSLMGVPPRPMLERIREYRRDHLDRDVAESAIPPFTLTMAEARALMKEYESLARFTLHLRAGLRSELTDEELLKEMKGATVYGVRVKVE